MKNFLLSCLIGGTLVGSVQVSQAVVVTTSFAQFTQTDNSKPWIYTARSPFDLVNPNSTLTASLNVSFKYIDFLLGTKAGYHPSMNVFYTGVLTFTGSGSLGEAPLNSGQNPFDVTSYTFIADNSATNATAGITQGTVLLAGKTGNPLFDPNSGANGGDGGILTAPAGGSSPQFGAHNEDGETSTQPEFVSFTSDVINTTGIFTENFSLSFSSAVPSNSYTSILLNPARPFNPITNPVIARYLNSFRADATGTFGASYNAVPEPGAYALLGSLLVGSAFGLRRRRNRK